MTQEESAEAEYRFTAFVQAMNWHLAHVDTGDAHAVVETAKLFHSYIYGVG